MPEYIDREALLKSLNEEGITYNAAVDFLIRSAPAVGEWISVKDRLPEELTPVLIYTEAKTDEPVSMGFLEDGKWTDGYSGRGIVLIQQELVTHWMHLPPPPEPAP